MEVILPQDVHDEHKFLDCAQKLEYDEFSAKMFVFCNGRCDMDVFELMGNDRLTQLIYGWEVCHLPTRDSFEEEPLQHMAHVLAHHSLQIWFSQEWRTCSEGLKHMLLYCLTKAVPAFYQMKVLDKIDWPYILKFQTSPWRVPYLQKLFVDLRKNKHHVIEHAVPPATNEEIQFLNEDGLNLIILRLMQLFNAGNFEAVKQLSLRMLSAWLKSNSTVPFTSFSKDTMSITLVGHLYLLTVFVMDENRGYVIDNMMYNIRFYAQSMQDALTSEDIIFTPARLIAQVCVRLRLSKSGFFEQIGFKKFKLNLVTSFAVMLEAYTSYVLGNQLMELMGLNEHDFMESLPEFKELMYRYVVERESSESFLLEELKKLESQRNSHCKPNVVNFNLNYQQQICKGNRASNIGNYKNCDDDEKPQVEPDEEQDRQIDPVFQNVPNNEEVLSFVYKLLAEREFTGWKFAKIALLLKIIGQQLNAIEIWRYHPGLTTEFMLNLEQKMSENYADLAKVFSDHGFMEAEFWLTAFYLNPINTNYNEVKRCSRIKKKRQEEDHWPPAAAAHSVKYELLSSTIDVEEIVTATNHDAPVADYEPIYKALQALRLPRSIIKDLLTVVFQPRNKRYSWALDWNTLHERCSALLKSKDLKNKFVALNMAEASDRLEFLTIDYAKYRDRPQLDYGTIEEGYENAANLAETEVHAEAEASAAEDEEDAKGKPQKKRRPPKRKFWDEVYSEDEEEEAASSDSEAFYAGGGRRTRIRAAAMVANAMLSDMDRTVRCGRRSNSPAPSGERHESDSEPETHAEEEPPKPQSPKQTSVEQEKQTISNLMEARTKFSNETNGFKAFADIWSFEKEELQNVPNEPSSLRECSSVLSKFRNFRAMKENAALVGPKPQSQNQQLESQPEPKQDSYLQPQPQTPQVTQRSGKHMRSGSETESVNSETSTMATIDFNGEDEQTSDDLSSLSKDPTPPPPNTSDFVKDTEVLHTAGKKLELLRQMQSENLKNEEQTEAPNNLTQHLTELVEGQLPEAIKNGMSENPHEENPDKLRQEQIASPFSKEIENLTEEVDPLRVKSIDDVMQAEKPTESQEFLENALLNAIPTTSTNTDTETDTAEETLLHDDADRETPSKRLRMHTDSKESNLSHPQVEERERLIQECLSRTVEVRLKLLTPQDIEKLRGLRVRIKRTNLVDFCREKPQPQTQPQTQTHPQRKRDAAGRFSEESNTSTQSSGKRKPGRKRHKKFVHITSDSPPCSMSPRPIFKHITSDSSTDLEEVPPTRTPAPPRKRGRPAGPKCKALQSARKSARPMSPISPDVIELSSDSSDAPVPKVSGQRIMFERVTEMDPLYEEAIVPF
ncbi:hypothetical protein KR009_011230 [Drosophila setifemur]|nr:hypothetical protein KR009_011230 [Drosophila setifemur]